MRTNSRSLASKASALVVFVIAGFVAGSLGAFAKDEPKSESLTLSKKVIPPLKAANDALNNKQFDVVAKKLDEAEAVDKKTPYDQFRIEEMRAIVDLQTNKFADAFAIYEKHLSNPEYLEPQQSEIRGKVLTQLAFQTQAHPKVIQYGKEWIATHPDDTKIIDLMARSAYIQKDYKSALEFSKNAIDIAEKGGQTPDELWLQLVPSCASNLDNQAEVLSGYQKLVRYYPKPEHWSKVLEAILRTEKNDVATLNALRLMADTDTLTRPDYYYEYAQRAVEQALPGEAVKVLESGFEKKIIGTGADKDRYDRTVADLRRKAQQDKAQLPEIEKEVRDGKSKTGQSAAGLGLAYFSFQMYDQAVQALESAMAKGGLRNVDDYRMALAISYLRTGQKDKAREQFQAIPASSPVARIAGLWAARTYSA